MKVTIQLSGIEDTRQMLKKVGEASKRALMLTAIDVEDMAHVSATKHEANKRPGVKTSGRLSRSLVRFRDGDDWVVGHDEQHAPFAKYVQWGTRPHDIRPKNKKALRWPVAVGFRYAKVVHHPGYKGDAYFFEAARQAPLRFAAHLDEIIKRETGK